MIRITRLFAVWMIITFCGWPLAAAASGSFGEKLARADAIRSSDPAEFSELLRELNGEQKEATKQQAEVLAYLNAYAHVMAGRNEQAIDAARKLIDASDDVDIDVRAGALIVNASAITRQFADGLRQLEQTLALLDKIKNHEYREHVWGVAAVIHNQTGQYRIAREYAERVLANTQSVRAKCFAGQTRLEAMQKLGEITTQDAPFNDLISLCASQKEHVVANFARAMLARKWAHEGKYKEATRLLREYLKEVEASRYPALIAEFHSLLGEYELSQGQFESADEHARAAIGVIMGSDFLASLVSAYKTRYMVAEAKGDEAAAFAQYRLFAEADKAYLNEAKARELAYQIVRHETLQQTQQIELLNKQNEVLTLQQQVQQQNAQNTRLLVLLLLLLLASIAFWAYKTKRVQMSLKRMAETDALTGICNRHHFTQQSELALAQCARAGEDVALVMFDLDHFKSINDRFGHDTGDWVLKQVVAACAPVCRQIDYFGRIGGEEFAILLIGMDARGAKRLAEDCRVRIAGIESGGIGYLFKPSASFGVTTTALSGYDLAKMLSHADKMLYRAKRGGRNRVFVYEVPVPVQLPVPVGDAHGEPAPVPDATEQAGDASDGVAVEDRSMQQRAVAVS
jgi:diguanylate cyclase (GGDEF)-like protein